MLLLALVAAASHATTLAGGGSAVPPWPPTWQMNLSTIIQPCNSSGYFDPEAAAQWGVIDFDWSNAKELWANSKPMDTNERLLAQAAAVKRASGGRTKVFIYRNLVKALPWFTQVREKLEDSRYAGWFLRFKGYRGAASNHSYHVPACTDDKCSGCASAPPPPSAAAQPSMIATSQLLSRAADTEVCCASVYHDQLQSPQHPACSEASVYCHNDGVCAEECDCGSIPCGEYLYNHANASLRQWILDEIISGPSGLGDPNVDGCASPPIP